MNRQTLLSATLLLLSLSLCAPGVRADQNSDAGISLYNHRRYAEAVAYLEAAMKASPDDPFPLYYAALSYHQLRNYAKAIELYQKLVQTTPDSEMGQRAALALKALPQNKPSTAAASGSAPSAATDHSDKKDASASNPATPASKPVGGSAQELINALVQVNPPKGKLAAVTPAYTQSVKQILKDVPIPVLSFLQSKGVRLYVMPSLVEYDYRIQNTKPRGWDEDNSWKDSPAMCTGKDVIISQYRNDPKTGENVDTTDELGVVRHELGHAIDHCLGDFSQTEKFKHAYYLDSANVPEEVRAKVAYFLQGADAGPAETFAELCCAKFGGETEGRKESCDLVKQYFVLTNKELEARLNQL